MIGCAVHQEMQHVAYAIAMVRIPRSYIWNDTLSDEHEADGGEQDQSRLPQRRALATMSAPLNPSSITGNVP